ncbi:MAG: LysR family transcriptional regulator [Duodenibacillus sp.]|nr:LysR family transcriptional regulator [Duodenibacillus sp.]
MTGSGYGLHGAVLQPAARVFLALAATGSFTLAARRLGISQPAASRAIAALEEELGMQLIDHCSRPVRLTASGRGLQRLLSREAGALEAGIAGLRERASAKEPLRLGVVESLAHRLGHDLVEDLRAAADPVALRTGISSYLLQLLDADQLDAVVCPDPFLHRNDLARRFILREPSLVIAPRGRLKGPLTWEKLQRCGLPAVRYSASNSGGRLQEKYFNKLGISFASRIEVDINALLLEFVAQGEGWALTRPTTLAQHPEIACRVDILAMPEPVASREVYAVARKGPAEQFLDRIADRAAAGFAERIVPSFVGRAPWTRPYLYVRNAAGDPVQLFSSGREPASEVLVL